MQEYTKSFYGDSSNEGFVVSALLVGAAMDCTLAPSVHVMIPCRFLLGLSVAALPAVLLFFGNDNAASKELNEIKESIASEAANGTQILTELGRLARVAVYRFVNDDCFPLVHAKLYRVADHRGNFPSAVESTRNGHCNILLVDSKCLRRRGVPGYPRPIRTKGSRLKKSNIISAVSIKAARALGDKIFYIHGKDARIERYKADIDGLLENLPVDKSADRTWNYVAVGCGHEC